MKRPSLLLFDLGGVLIESSVFEQLKHLLHEPEDDTEIKERWLKSPVVRQFESGKISAAEFAERFIAEWNLPCSSETFLEAFATWPRNFFPGAKEALLDWRQSYKVACLSNSNPLHKERFGDLHDLFDVTLFSHLLGAVKPDREIFQRALEECGVEPYEVYFFDDSPANVCAAQQFGIKAFCVDGFESVQHLLRSEGLVA
ncbi:MAG: HAD family hydrolase [Gammaproteobacteria bacterium]